MKQHKHSTADYTIDTKMSYFSFHKCMIFFFLLQLFLLFNSNVFGQTECNCSKAFEEVQNIAQENYAGYDYNVNLHGKANYKKLCRKLKKKVKHTNNKQECEAQLIKYAQFFKDKHFNIITEDLMEQLESSNLPPEFTMYKNGKVSYLKVPSFDLEYKAKIDSLLLANHKKIIQSEVFIIDVSDNEGGSDDAYSSLTPYYYTNPYTVEGVDFKASKGNIEEFELYLTYTDYFDEETLKGIQKWVDKAKSNPGSFVNVESEQTVTIDTTYNVPKVAVIITGAKSAAEGLILEAIQSEKVTTFGENSGGVRDFLNVRHQPLSSCDITVGLPTTKSTRVPENAIDGVGIEPDVFCNYNSTENNIEKIISYFNIK